MPLLESATVFPNMRREKASDLDLTDSIETFDLRLQEA